MTESKQIYVTQPSLPPLEEYVELLKDIWDRKWLTNRGLYHDRFEQQLAEYLGVKHVSLFCNGMIALQVGLQALKITGEVITTPYSFPATTHALWWNHCTPVFCDIDPKTCNLDPQKIESLITPRTTAILPVHVYGNPCDVAAIQKIADTYGLKVFYDAAHAFGVRVQTADCRPQAADYLTTEDATTTSAHPESRIPHPESISILNFGDLSMISFHATKVFNTAEGGALITNDPKLKERIDYLKNFGFANETTVVAPGTNGKMNELQAALGIVQLRYVDDYIQKRLEVDRLYREALAGIPGIRMLESGAGVTRNGAYFPIFVDEFEYGISRDALYERLKAEGINGRRYFYPLISHFPMYRGLVSTKPESLTVAERFASEVICLPSYAALGKNEVARVVDVIGARGEGSSI